MKTSLGKCFTPLCVFGSNSKYNQTKIALHFDCKKTPFDCKIIYTLILPLMYFRTTQPEKERERERESEKREQIVMPPPPPSQAPAKLKSCCPHHPDCLNQASSFFYLFPQLFFSFLLNVANLAATDHQPTPLHPQTHPIWPPLSSIHSDLSLSWSISFPQFVTLSSPSHWVYHVYVVNKCFYFDFWLC